MLHYCTTLQYNHNSWYSSLANLKIGNVSIVFLNDRIMIIVAFSCRRSVRFVWKLFNRIKVARTQLFACSHPPRWNHARCSIHNHDYTYCGITFQDKPSDVALKSGSSSPGKKTNMVAPMPVVTSSVPSAQLPTIPSLPAVGELSYAPLPTIDGFNSDAMPSLTPSDQQLLAEYKMLLTQTTVVTNLTVPTLNFAMPQSQLLSSTTLLCNAAQALQLGAPQLPAFDPSVLSAMPGVATTTAGLIGQGRGGAMRRNVDMTMTSPPGGLRKSNT